MSSVADALLTKPLAWADMGAVTLWRKRMTLLPALALLPEADWTSTDRTEAI